MTLKQSSAPSSPRVEAWQVMEIPVLYTGVVDGFTNGVRVRTNGPRYEAQAWAIYETNKEYTLESPVYGLVPAADRETVANPLDTSQPFPAYNFTIEAAEARVEKAAVARAFMTADERSPRDLIDIARQLRDQARGYERQWQAQREAEASQVAQDQEDMALAARVQRGLQLLAAAQAQAQKETQDNGSK